jgi:PAS domain S-box-containing protein
VKIRETLLKMRHGHLAEIGKGRCIKCAAPLQVTIIGHERPPRTRTSRADARCRRIPLGAAARAGGGLGLATAVDRFQVDEAWMRAFGVDVSAAPMPVRDWKRRIHPDDLGAFNAATDSCQHGGDRFECEYRLLAAGHRWLWVLHRGRVVQRDRDGSAVRITGLLLDVDRRKSEEVARSDSESRLATALWARAAAFWQWHVPSNSRTASPLWLAMTGYSRAQWDATPNPWFSNLHPEDRERVDAQLREHAQGERDSVEFEYRFQTASGDFRWMQDRGRAVEWDLQGRPVLVIGVTLDIDAAKHAEAHLRSSETMLETAAWGRGIGLWETNFSTDTSAGINDWCQRHDIDPLRRHSGTSTAGTPEPAPGRGPRGPARPDSDTRRRQGRFLRRRATASARAGGQWRWCSNAAAWWSATPTARPCACSACAWISTRARSPSVSPNARNDASRRRCQANYRGRVGLDVENGITHNTDGYYECSASTRRSATPIT